MGKRKIIWSHRAKIKLFEILDFYTTRNQSPAYSKKLFKRFRKELNILTKQPDIGHRTDDESVRGLIVYGKFILYYSATSDSIILHTIWDCRQNPEDLIIKSPAKS
jgi:plasmid stabilization system protein ParE